MGISIYYTASRPHPPSPAEQSAIDLAVERYPLASLLAECGMIADEYNGEDFGLYPADGDEPDVVLDGATKLPLCSQDAMWAAVRYWCRLLSEIRRLLPGTSWRVHVDDHEISWDEGLKEFDPSA